jgi:hypothetical protein
MLQTGTSIDEKRKNIFNGDYSRIECELLSLLASSSSLDLVHL